MEYAVELVWLTDEPLTQDLLTDVAAISGAAGGNVGEKRLDLTLTIKASSAWEAVEKAQDKVAALVPGDILSATVATLEESDRREAEERARAELVGIAEIADMLGVSKQRAHTLSGRDDFPAPVDRLKQGSVWRRRDLSTFASGWQRAAGRPKGTTEGNKAREKKIMQLKAKGLTQAQIGKRLKVSQPLVSMVLKKRASAHIK